MPSLIGSVAFMPTWIRASQALEFRKCLLHNSFDPKRKRLHTTLSPG